MHDDRDWGLQTASEGRFGYASRHLMIGLDPARAAAIPTSRTCADMRPRCRCGRCCSMRGPSSSTTSATRARCRPSTSASSTAASPSPPGSSSSPTASSPRSGNGSAALRPRSPTARGDDDPRFDTRELAAYLAGQYSEAGWSRTDHYSWIAGLLLELGITSLVELGEVLREADEATIAARMDYRHPPGAVRRLDDALLWVFGDRYVALHQNASGPDCCATGSSGCEGDSAVAAPRRRAVRRPDEVRRGSVHPPQPHQSQQQGTE